MSEQFRIALARAILRDPALLIIEEPETALDEETKDLLDDTFARRKCEEIRGLNRAGARTELAIARQRPTLLAAARIAVGRE